MFATSEATPTQAAAPTAQPSRRLLAKPAVLDKLGISLRHFERLRSEDPRFPKPLALGGPRSLRWEEADIDRYIDAVREDGFTPLPSPKRRARLHIDQSTGGTASSQAQP